MNLLREIALSFCAAAVMTAAVGLISGGRLQMSMKYIISLCLICSVVSAAVGGKLSLAASVPAFTPKPYSADNLYRYQAEYIVGEILKKEGITYQNITAKATKFDDGSIIIIEIEISGCNDAANAKNKLSLNGIDCDIKVTP